MTARGQAKPFNAIRPVSNCHWESRVTSSGCSIFGSLMGF